MAFSNEMYVFNLQYLRRSCQNLLTNAFSSGALILGGNQPGKKKNLIISLL